MDDNELIQIRKDKILSFVKKKSEYFIYALLAVVVFISVWIRTRNLPGLRDITTGEWTLGPDLDPFLFLRWAKYIVEHGSLFAVDTMRYVPLGLETSKEYLLHPYMIAWFHNVISIFWDVSVTQSAVIYPVFFFALTIISFFLMTREIFVNRYSEKIASLIALLSAFFLAIIPSFLNRTIAGIPEKESAAFFFMFMAIYFFIFSFRSKNKKQSYYRSILAGIFTAGMAHIWGGFVFIFSIIGLFSLLMFILGKFDKLKIQAYVSWIFSSILLMLLVYPGKHAIKDVIFSSTTAISFFVLVVLIIDVLISKYKLQEKYGSKLKFLPPKLFSIFVSVVLGIITAFVFLTPEGFFKQIKNVFDILVKPATDRLIQTVAENRQPYFAEWASSFGPYFGKIYILFTLSLASVILLFFQEMRKIGKKEAYVFTSGLSYFFIALIFSRYSGSSILNGENFISLLFLLSGFIVIGVISLYYYFKRHKNQTLSEFRNLDLSILFLISFLIIGIVASRAAIRGIFISVPIVVILSSALIILSLIKVIHEAKKKDKNLIKIILYILVIMAGIYSSLVFYNQSVAISQSFVPSQYNQQWQNAMEWVRSNTPQEAVFAHWWDYGYWIQSIGERATLLDGGNAIGYWNHLMGRHVLTGNSEREALEFLYTHNATHLLIDSTDIGKYGAYSYIGSNATLDRRSELLSFVKDISQTYETKESINYIYKSYLFPLEEDIIYEINGTQVRLPANVAAIGGVIIPIDNKGLVQQARGIFIYKGNQYVMPLRYLAVQVLGEEAVTDFGSGVNAGVYIMPSVNQVNSQANLDLTGALIYLGPRTVQSNFAKLYLYGLETQDIKLVHEQPDYIVEILSSQDPNFEGSFVYLQGVRGPIKIWEIDYPEGIEYNPEFISKIFPSDISEGL